MSWSTGRRFSADGQQQQQRSPSSPSVEVSTSLDDDGVIESEDAALQKAANASRGQGRLPGQPDDPVNTLTGRPPPAMTIDTSKTYTATVKTTTGTFVVALDASTRPKQ